MGRIGTNNFHSAFQARVFAEADEDPPALTINSDIFTPGTHIFGREAFDFFIAFFCRLVSGDIPLMGHDELVVGAVDGKRADEEHLH